MPLAYIMWIDGSNAPVDPGYFPPGVGGPGSRPLPAAVHIRHIRLRARTLHRHIRSTFQSPRHRTADFHLNIPSTFLLIRVSVIQMIQCTVRLLVVHQVTGVVVHT